MKEREIMFPEIDKEKTGERIRFLMELRGLSVKDVCRTLSLGCVQAVYKWLDGINLPSLDNMYCLSILLQVPMDSIICDKGNSEEIRYSNTCTKRVFSYYKKIRKQRLPKKISAPQSSFRIYDLLLIFRNGDASVDAVME